MNNPFSDLLVVSVEQALAAPLCTSRLVDMGARVIKIERAGGISRAAMMPLWTGKALILSGPTKARNLWCLI